MESLFAMNVTKNSPNQYAIANLLTALRAIPQHEKVEWLHVLRVAPHLVETESDPMAFLRYCDWNAEAAARRLTVYWRKRRILFGEARAFLPLDDFSGNGALGPDEIELIRCGAYYLTSDTYGRSVGCADRCRIPDRLVSLTDVRLRAIFFIFHQGCQNQLSQTLGAVCIIRHVPDRNVVTFGKLLQEISGLIHGALPLRVHAIHVIHVELRPKSSFLWSFVPMMVEHFSRFISSKLQLHSCKSAEEAAMKLARHGILRESLPQSLFGRGSFGQNDGGMTSGVDAGSKKEHQQSGSDLDPIELEQLADNNEEPGSSKGFKWLGLLSTDAEGVLMSDDRETSALGSEHLPIEEPTVNSSPAAFTRPHKRQATIKNDILHDMADTLFIKKMAANLTSFDSDDCPFEPRPIGSPPAHSDNCTNPGTVDFGLEEGLSDCVEATLDGGISVDGFDQWMENQQLLESQLYAGDQLEGEQDQRQEQHPPPLPPVPVEPSSKTVTPTTTEPNTDDDESPSGSIASDSTDRPQDVDSAMALLSASEKEAYMEALKNVPNLVTKESDPARFLKSEDNDAEAAARRLAAYWRIRKEVFGKSAFLPMDQTNDGALDRKAMAALQSSFLMQLPNDSSGCSVICCDGTRLEERPKHSSQLRVFFYLWTVVSQNDLSQTDGYSVLYTITDPEFDKTSRNCLELVMRAHPVRLKYLHLLGCLPDGVGESYFSSRQETAREMTKLLGPAGQDMVVYHVCTSRFGFANKLVAYGMSKDVLPKPFGGMWDLEDFLLWQELRIRNDWDLPIRASYNEVAGRYSIPVFPVSPPPSRLSEAERLQRHRRLNVVYSQRKRDKERLEEMSLQEKRCTLEWEQKKLLSQSLELELLLQRAKAVVSEYVTR